MTKKTQTKIMLVGPADQCANLIDLIFIHCYLPNAIGEKNGISVDDIAKINMHYTVKNKISILSVKFKKFTQNDKNILNEEKILEFTEQVPDVFFVVNNVSQNKSVERNFMGKK